MGYQIPLDLGLCIIKSVTKRCHLTASRDCKHMDDQKAATYFSGKTSTTWLAHGITHSPSKKKSPDPHLYRVSSQTGELDEAPGWTPHLCLAWRPHGISPGKAIFPSTGQLYLNYSTPRLLGGVELLEKKKESEREKKVWILKGIYRWSNWAASETRGKGKKLENKQLCKMLSGTTKLTSVARPDAPSEKAARPLTRHGCLRNEVLVVGKQFSGFLVYWSLLQVWFRDWSTATWLKNTNNILSDV